ncbi:MAG: MATE family efflux transporter [Myxococcaceae bacterium]|nr:MATE family efflux transporter [Myxococcaceae bacterium]
MEAAAVASTVEPQPRASTFAAEARELLKLGWPLALAQAGQALFGVVDTAIVGRVGPQAQGAVGLGNAIFIGFGCLGMGIMMALDPLISQAMGAGEPGKARTHFWQGVWLSLIVSVLLAVPVATAPLALPGFGVDASLAHETWRYAVWRAPQLPLLLIFIATRAYLQSVNQTRILFIATVIANVVNFALCWWFVLELGFGVVGAAMATVSSAALQLGIVVMTFGPAPQGTRRELDVAGVKKTLRVGTPIGLQLFLEVAVFSAAGVIAGTLNEASIAAHQIAIQWASFTFCLAVGIGAAATVRVGWAIGARDTPAARRSGLTAMALGVLVMSSSALFFFTFPHIPAEAMTDRADVLEVVVALFTVTAVFQVFDGIQAVAAGALRGAGDTRFAFWANLAGHYGVGLPISMLLGIRLGQGVIGLWWGLCAGLIAVSLALLGRFVKLTSREVKAL